MTNIKYHIVLLFGLTLYCVHGVVAQKQENPEPRPGIRIIASAAHGQIRLRWAPNSPVAWQLLNRYGYWLERFTLTRKGNTIENPQGRKLVSTPLRPAPLEHWEEPAEVNDFAAIAAQAIHGETFELSEGYSSDIVQVINKSRELEQRFSFALFSADMSATVALRSGLSFTDNDARENERYVYRVYSAAPAGTLELDTGYVYIGLEDEVALPRPERPEAEFGDLSVMLKWNSARHRDIYTAYRVERSDDGGKTYRSITDLPITNTAPSNGRPDRFMYKADSLPRNNREYFYRVAGITPFAETGPASEPVSGIGRDEMGANPAITKGEVLAGQAVKLEWFFDERYNGQLKGFRLSRAESARGKYNTVTDNIPIGSREVHDRAPLTTNYYKLTALGRYGQEVSSMPYLVQLIDSIPPSPPLELTGKVDTTGLVTLNWKANTEKDLLGYRVFRSNFEGDEFTQVTVSPVEGTVFYDTLAARAITDRVFYKVTAVDRHYNPSVFSAAAGLERPDIVPPVPPVFKEVKVLKEGIQLSWHPSSSSDVEEHLLYRRRAGTGKWSLVKVFGANDTTRSYLDAEAAFGAHQEYTMIARDGAKLESRPATPVRARRLGREPRMGIEKLSSKYVADKGVRLTWEHRAEGVLRYVIYRSSGDIGLSPLGNIRAPAGGFMDGNVTEGENYRYRVMAIFADGARSGLSEEVKVTIE